jgi:hypothetical protein
MLVSTMAFASQGFWMLMIFDCVRSEPKGSSWLWLLIMLNFPGAVIYFAARKLPNMNIPMPSVLKRWTMRDALWNAEAGIKNIGKPHQYVILGNVLLEMGNLDRALEAYNGALMGEPANSNALWGCGTIEMQQRKFDLAREHITTLLKKEPDYKQGEASLLYGKVLYELEQWSAAKEHLDRDVKHWSHAESFILLAKIAIRDGDLETAKSYLETTIARIKASPKFNYRRNQHLIGQAEKILKTLAR